MPDHDESTAVAARRLYEAGQRRARERAAAVQALRIDRTHPLVLAVLERWGWDPPTVSDALAEQAVSAVDAVVNCLGSRPEPDEAPTSVTGSREARDA